MRKKIINELNGYNHDEISYSSNIIARGKQKFAIFGNTAFDVSRRNYNDLQHGMGFVPVRLNGEYVLLTEDYGDGINQKILCFHIFLNRGKTVRILQWLSVGWLYASELQLPIHEINQKIMDEIDTGCLNLI